MDSELGNCFNCNIGTWIDIFQPHSYDFNTDGYVPKYCNNCFITRDSYVATIQLVRDYKKIISNRKLKKILWILCSDDGMQQYRNEIYYKIRDDKGIISIMSLIDEIINDFIGYNIFLEKDDVISVVIDCINS